MLNLPGHWDEFEVRREHLLSHGFKLERFLAAEGAKLFAAEYKEKKVCFSPVMNHDGRVTSDLCGGRLKGSRCLS